MHFQLSVVDGQVVKGRNGSFSIDIFAQPNESERHHLTEDLNIDEYTLNSALDPAETPRIEFEKDYTVFILKYPRSHSDEDEFRFRVNSIGIFLFSSGDTIIICNEKLPLVRLPGSREGKTAEYISTQRELLLRILSQTIRRFDFYMKLIANCRDMLKERMIRSRGNKHLMDMFTLREGLIYYINALRGNHYLIERIHAAAGKLGFTKENIELLEDYAIENQQFLDQAQVYSQILTDLMDAWTSIINNNLSVVMKNMNSLVIAFSLPVFFTGLGGMSEFTAFLAPYLKWYISYPLFVGCMALLSVLLYHLIQRFYKA